MANTSAYRLYMHYGEQRIGCLMFESGTNLLKLVYDKAWQTNGFAISPGLPLNNQHSPEVAYNYLDNALPEGEARQLLAENLGVSEKNVYSQVRAIGNDLAGAVTFSPTEQDKPAESTTKLRVLEEQELQARLNTKEQFGLLTWDDKPRLSVAGVQHKLNVFINQAGVIGFGEGALCSTHILKFEKKNSTHLVLNEYFCMTLSRAIGLPTAEVSFKRFGSHPALVVKRFDRKYLPEDNKVMRRHVIDGCQALNLPREYKYERNLGDGRDVQHIRDGASLKSLFKLCDRMTSPIESKQWLINWQLFNLMISNYDSHGKNVSLFFDKNIASFTPAYDLVNIAMFPQFKGALAMAMGDEFDPNSINAYQLADFAETCNIDKKLLTRHLTTLADKVIYQLTSQVLMEQLKKQGCFYSEEMHYFEKLSENILTTTKHLQSQISDIVTIKV